MAHNIENIMRFNGEISSLEGKKIKIYDENTISLKLAILVAVTDEDKWKKMLNVTNYSSVAKNIDKAFKGLDQKDIVEFLDKTKDLDIEIIEYFSGFDDIMDKLKKPTAMKEVDWFDNELIKPCPLGVLINGFSSSFYKSLKLDALKDFPSGYDWNVQNLGSKWGIYDAICKDDKLFYSTAWESLNDETLVELAKKVKFYTGKDAVTFYCEDPDLSFLGRGEFLTDLENEMFINVEYMDLSSIDDDGDGENEVDKPQGTTPNYSNDLEP